MTVIEHINLNLMEKTYKFIVTITYPDGMVSPVSEIATTKYHAIELAYTKKKHLQSDRSMYRACKTIW